MLQFNISVILFKTKKFYIKLNGGKDMVTKQRTEKSINQNKNVNIKELNILNTIFCFSVIMIHITSRPIAVMNKESFAYLFIFIIKIKSGNARYNCIAIIM